jgi:hypothetical protein
MGAKKLQWQTFIMSPAGEELNALAIETRLPSDAARFYLAVLTQMFEHYVAKAGPHRGFGVVTGVTKPDG